MKRLKSDSEAGLMHRTFGVGPLYPRPVVTTLLCIFCLSVFLTVNWFGLLLLNSEGVLQQIGINNALRTTAALMGGISLSSILLMAHYHCMYTYESDGNVFFGVAFTLSFLLGAPCSLIWVFG